MAGINANEGTVLTFEFPIFSTNQTITKLEIKEHLPKCIYLNHISDLNYDSVYEYYLKDIDESNQIAIRQSYGRIIGDPMINCPTYFFAKYLSKNSANSKLYFYESTHKANQAIIKCDENWMGICHAEDLNFVFGLPVQIPHKYNDIDYKFSLLIMEMWTNFAKYGYSF